MILKNLVKKIHKAQPVIIGVCDNQGFIKNLYKGLNADIPEKTQMLDKGVACVYTCVVDNLDYLCIDLMD